MSKVLDLTQFTEQYLTLKLPDGDTIKIKKPTERLKIKLMACVEEQIQLQALGVKGEESTNQDKSIILICWRI